MNLPLVPVPQDILLSPDKVAQVLEQDAVSARIMAEGGFPEAGDLVGVRLNLNVLKSTGVAIQTLHKATNAAGYKRNQGFYNGKACGYAQAVHLKNAFFNVQQGARESIATGQAPKSAMASVDGQLVKVQSPEGFEGVEIRFNPRTDHLFVDANGHAVQFAEEAVVLGHRVYAKGIRYHTELTAPPRAGDAPSNTQFKPSPALEETQAAPRRVPRP